MKKLENVLVELGICTLSVNSQDANCTPMAVKKMFAIFKNTKNEENLKEIYEHLSLISYQLKKFKISKMLRMLLVDYNNIDEYINLEKSAVFIENAPTRLDLTERYLEEKILHLQKGPSTLADVTQNGNKLVQAEGRRNIDSCSEALIQKYWQE